jgi:hypothetical protein
VSIPRRRQRNLSILATLFRASVISTADGFVKAMRQQMCPP